MPLRPKPIFDTNIFGHVHSGLIPQSDWDFILRRRERYGWRLSMITALELLAGIHGIPSDKFPNLRRQVELAFALSKGRLLEDPVELICREVLVQTHPELWAIPRNALILSSPFAVGIETDAGSGTGFIVSLDGWILTARHVVTNIDSNKNRSQIEVMLIADQGGFETSARVVAPEEAESSILDFALLKVKALPREYSAHHQKIVLKPLELGDEKDESVGSEVGIFGRPMAGGLPEQLCLFGNVSEIIQPDIFYQGAAVGGMSGGPIMSLDSGKVIGIVRRRTADIPQLEEVQKQFNTDLTFSINSGQRDLASRKALSGLLQLLDVQFNNGVGAGVTISGARTAFENAVRNSSHPEATTGKPQ